MFISCNAVISASTSCKERFMCFLCSICEAIYFAVNRLPEVILFLINTHQINTLTWADVNHVLPVEICGMTIIQDLKIQHNAVTTFLHQGGGHGSRTDDTANISRKDAPVKGLVPVGKPSHDGVEVGSFGINDVTLFF